MNTLKFFVRHLLCPIAQGVIYGFGIAFIGLIVFVAIVGPPPSPSNSSPACHQGECPCEDEPVQQVIHSDIDEYSIAYQLASLSEDFAKLPDSRFVDRMDFAAALRQARNIVARRVMRRAEPHLFDKTILPYEDDPLLRPAPDPAKAPTPVTAPVPS